MAHVQLTDAANAELGKLPASIRVRMQAIFERLTKWPTVSGAKPLRGDRAGQYRIRAGDYRLIFTAIGDDVLIVRIGIRRDVYED